MSYSLNQDQISAALSGKDLHTYHGWLAAAKALLADAPEWTAIQQMGGDCYVVKRTYDGLSNVFTCPGYEALDHIYSDDDLGDFDISAWGGECWDCMEADVDANTAVLTNPIFLELRHA